MGGFFLLLVVTNLAFLGWQFWGGAEEVELVPHGVVGMQSRGLPLLSELADAEHPPQRETITVESKRDSAPVVEMIEVESRPAPELSAAAEATDALGCYQSSHLSDLVAAKAFQAEISNYGVQDSQRKTVETTKVNYWVKLPPYDSRKKATEAAEILRDNRVKDFFIVRSGRHENAVSLGVFSSRERAEQRYSEITKLRARLRKPVIEAMELPAKRIVVEFVLAQSEITEGLRNLLDSTKQPHLKKIACNR